MKSYDAHIAPQIASLCLDPPRLPRPTYTSVHRRGLAYERKAQEELLRRYGKQYIPEVWFTYRLADDNRARFCQCDGLLIDAFLGKLVIVEIKLQHTQQAVGQLRNLYLPVVAKAFDMGARTAPAWKIATCEMVNWFDCATRTSQPVKLRSEIDLSQPGEFAVHIWSPSRKFKYH